MKLDLPLPPSINAYHGLRTVKSKNTGRNTPIKFVSHKGRAFVRDTKKAVLEQGSPMFGRAKLAVRIDVHLPTKAGDHHNREKPILDALEESRVFDNDKQVIDLRVVKKHPVKGGRCHVTIWEIENV